MPPLRFRAWDTEREQMLYGVEKTYDTLPHYTLQNGTKVDQADTGFWLYDSFGDFVEKSPELLMQSTGLEDKNGVEIFEGDIVSSAPGSGSADAGNDRLIVKWDHECAGFFFDRPGFKQTTYIFRKEYVANMEVIGHLHQEK